MSTGTDHRPAPSSSWERTLRTYRYTVVYIAVAVTVVLGLAIWDRVSEPEDVHGSSCIVQPTSTGKGAR